MERYRSDYPVLIVNGNVEFDFAGAAAAGLVESSENTNFNPTGAPYSGVVDADNTDSYPSEIVGLVHIIGNFEAKGATTRIRGALIATGAGTFSGTTQINYLSDLATSPPWGYVEYPSLKVSPGSWQRSVE
jgi:hypothetical protein